MAAKYVNWSLRDLEHTLRSIASQAEHQFINLDYQQVNWKPSSTGWSVAQCLEHMLKANVNMLRSIDGAMADTRPLNLWQRMPLLPALFGWALIKSQMPETKQKMTAPAAATPSQSVIDGNIVEQFIGHQHELIRRIKTVNEFDADRVVMVSPFVSVITYTVLDGYRLLVTHECRHIAQAERVLEHPDFPKPDIP